MRGRSTVSMSCPFCKGPLEVFDNAVLHADVHEVRPARRSGVLGGRERHACAATELTSARTPK